CPERHLVAFSCKRRGFCPSCLGRRMAQTTANLLDHVLPQTPLRQWVLTVPHALRTRLAYDRVLLARVGRLFVATVLGFYRRRLGDLRVHPGRGQSGAVTVVQRTSADLKLNPHLDSVFLDGVYAPGADGKPVFHALPRLSTSDVADVLQAARARILGDLRRRGVVVMDDDSENPLVEDDGFSAGESALAHLAAAAVSGAPPAGPERRSRPPIPLRGHPGVAVTAPLTVTEMGFSLHAATHAGAHDARAREALVKYILRPPIAQERLRLLPDDLVRIVLRRPFRDATTAIPALAPDPLSLSPRPPAAVPPPRQHGIRYAGVLAAASKWRAQVVPPPLPSPAAEPDPQGELPQRPSPPPTWRCRYRPWAELLRRAFAIDVTTCPPCGGPFGLSALL